MNRNALVSQTRMPEFDRDRGSGRVDQLITFLLDAGWNVTFLADEELAHRHHARRLRQRGVATFAGYSQAVDVIQDGHFDLAVIAFWKQASILAPLLREHSPSTKIIVDSIDLHFLREARRSFGVEGRLDDRFGVEMTTELNTYRSVDSVLAVSAKETSMLGDFIGEDRVREVTLAADYERSQRPFDQRRGILFVGNFRHLPNGEAVEYLCKDVLPRIDPKLLAAHPVTIVGNRLDDKIRRHATGVSSRVRMVGWVPSITPYLEDARVAVVPLLHGAGIKGKVVEAMVRGTPVVTTSIGAEGLGLVDGHDAFVAPDAATLASSIARLLVDRSTWDLMRTNAWEKVTARNSASDARVQFLAVINEVLDDRAGQSGHDVGFRHARSRMDAYRANVGAVARLVEHTTDPGAIVLVTSHGDDELVEFKGRTGWHFPRQADGDWAGHHPADSDQAIRHLSELCDAGAQYLVLPTDSFWWLHHYDSLAFYLDEHHRRIHADANAIIYDLRHPREQPLDRHQGTDITVLKPRVLVRGTYDPTLGGPSASLVAELDSSRHFTVTQTWVPAEPMTRRLNDRVTPDFSDTADFFIDVDASADLPSGFLDEFLALQTELAADRAQPAHMAGPSAAAPVTEQLQGCVARVVTRWTPIPLRSVRAGAALDGPVLLLDATPIGLPFPNTVPTDAEVTDVYVASQSGPVSGVRRSIQSQKPLMSVLIATYERPSLLEACLEGFCDQSLDQSDYEVIVVDDGSDDAATQQLIDRFHSRVSLTSVRIAHAGRSTAKNLGVMLARGALVVFFDDDDRPSPTLLAEHLAAHDASPEEHVAILGFTDWAPELEVTPLMHFLTDVDKILFAYGNLADGQVLDWRGFWEGRLSCKRSLLMRHGLHDQRLVYSIDVEMAWRLAPFGLQVRYRAAAVSHMARSIDLPQFCARIEAKGRAQARIAALHDDPVIRSYTKIDNAMQLWERAAPTLQLSIDRTVELQRLGQPSADDGELYRLYREVFAAFYAKGVVESVRGTASAVSISFGSTTDPEPSHDLDGTTAVVPFEPAGSTSRSGPLVLVSSVASRDRCESPLLTVTIPVWSRTEALAEMAQRTIARIREVASLATEIIVIDNGSPYTRPVAADVYRYGENRGVSIAWNAGISLAQADVVAVLNSDCRVEPGWDVALFEAATDARRIAFPYTDHVDGEGFRCPDQAGTAGWCFMMTRAVREEIGIFDEQFSPAFGEDTDYWHRAWELGVELTPVPAARVTHERRTTGGLDPHVDWLLQAHRYKYGWKHGVDPLRAPPYYHRSFSEFASRAR